jgi:HD-GYP domain-containing protein (c-di-GMP phosphodiesterase class II)
MATEAFAEREIHEANPTAGYLPIQIAMLRRLGQASVDLFIQNERTVEPVLYHRAGCAMDTDQVGKLKEGGVDHIYVRTEDFQHFGEHLLAAVDAQAEHESIPAVERYAALQLAMSAEIEHATRLVDCGPYVAVADRIGRELTTLMTNNNVLPRELFQLARHDFNTFTHVTNVASYGVLLAEKLGLATGNELEQITKAAILHDIGKRFIPATILSKPARLDPDERAIIETHPQRGYEELAGRDDMSFEQLMLVYQHHERIDGKGYPVGLQGDEIHPWARMLAVVDVFDAMTGTRPYRRPATAREAMDYICKNAGTHFDAEMVSCWNSMMAKS